MAAPSMRPCEPWPIPEDCCSSYADADPDLQASVAQAVTEALWALSGRRFGVCEHRVRPCRRKCVPSDLETFPALYGGATWDSGQWSIASICGCKTNCGCTNVCELILPGPIAEIRDVQVDGVSLGPALWRVDDWRRLVRKPGVTVAHSDWSDPDVYTEGTLVTLGDLTVAGDVHIEPLFPLLVGEKITIAPGPMSITVAGQDTDEPFDLALDLQFSIPGDTATVSNPLLVTSVTGAATYDPDTGVITYTGQPSPPRIQPELVTVHYLQSVKFAELDVPDGVVVSDVRWSDTRVDGPTACWPECQDYNAEWGDTGSWGVVYTRGRPVPELGLRAAGALACEVVKLCLRDESCSLPKNMAAMTRQGVTIRFQGKDATNALIEFVPEVALFLRTWNPNGLQNDSGVFRADAAQTGRRTRT